MFAIFTVVELLKFPESRAKITPSPKLSRIQKLKSIKFLLEIFKFLLLTIYAEDSMSDYSITESSLLHIGGTNNDQRRI